MNTSTEPARRSAISHAALSAGLALSSWGVVSDTATAQQQTRTPAPANGQNTQLDTITVSGQNAGEGDYNVQESSSSKFTAPLLDTPQTVTVIPQAIIKEQGARNLTEVLRNTPGISFDAGENGFATSTNNFKIRGFDASGSVYIDGTRDSGSYTRDIFNVEKVEVVKGPAADNGRGGAGGYVNMVTKTPSLQNFISGDVGYGWDQYDSKSRKRSTIDMNYAVNPTTAFRLNGLWEESGVPGREIAEMKPWGLAPSLAFGLGTDFRAIFAYEHVERNDVPEWGVPGATIPGTFRYDPRAAGAPRDAFYGLRTDTDRTKSDSFLARFEYDLTDQINVSNQTRWAHVDRFARYTIPTGFTPATGLVSTQRQYYDRTNTTVSNLTNLSAEFMTGTFKHNVSMGIELTREESDANRFGTQNAGNVSLFDPNPDRGVSPSLDPTQKNGVKIDTIAAYLYDTIELNRYWQITGGLRAERYKVNIDSETLAGVSQGVADGFQDTQTTLGGKVGIVFKPVDNGSIYASFGVSHLPPGSYLSNPDISRTGDNAFPGFVEGADPVRSYNYEAGVKWDFFNKRLSTAVAVFRTESRVPITGADVLNGDARLQGYGEQIVQGVELSASGYLTDAWQMFGGIVFLDSERRHSAELDEARRLANPGDYVSPDGRSFCCTNGDELAFTPNVTGNLWTTYRFQNGWTFGGGVQYVGSSWLGRPNDAIRIIPNGVFGELPGYTLFHALASYEVTKDVVVRFNVDNITNETYAVTTNWPGTRATLGAPRTFRVSTSFKF